MIRKSSQIDLFCIINSDEVDEYYNPKLVGECKICRKIENIFSV